MQPSFRAGRLQSGVQGFPGEFHLLTCSTELQLCETSCDTVLSHKVLSSYNVLLKLGNFSNRLSVSLNLGISLKFIEKLVFLSHRCHITVALDVFILRHPLSRLKPYKGDNPVVFDDYCASRYEGHLTEYTSLCKDSRKN